MISQVTRQSLLSLEGDRGKTSILGSQPSPRRAYQVAIRRARLAVGGKATGSHAHRRTSAVEMKNLKYREHLAAGATTRTARKLSVRDTVEHLDTAGRGRISLGRISGGR